MTDAGTTPKQPGKTALPNYSWLKLPIKLLADIDFMTLTDQSVSLFIKLYLMALRADAEGLVANERRLYTVKDVAWQLRKSEAETLTAIDELINAGFVDVDEHIRITHFIEEQGPGDNAQRVIWRERQRSRRAKLKQSGSEEVAESRVEKSRGSTGRHEDVPPTPTKPPPAASSSSSKDGALLKEWHELTNTRAKEQHLPSLRFIWETNEMPRTRQRLKLCGQVWKIIAAQNGWSANNPDAILELLEPDVLEERADREGIDLDKLR